MAPIENATPDMLRRLVGSLLETDPRVAAEVVYALAVLAARRGDREEARDHGLLSVKLFQDTQSRSLEDYSARHAIIGEVALPDIIHEGVVRDRLALLGVTV